jgi:hypothetical protein
MKYKAHHSVRLLTTGFVLLALCTLAQTASVPDTAFRNFLSKTYPTVIDGNGKLVLAEAAKVGGVVNGSNRNIASIEGIQYFTGARTISFVRTGLNFVPDLSNMVNLQGINLMYNQLSYLPDLSNLRRLKTLNLHSNYLNTLPDLSKNDSLLELNVNNNLLDSLPNLSKLIRLERLYVHNNRLQKLNGIENLVALKEFWCYSNFVSAIPSLDKLKNLQSFDASKNLLNSIPNFGNNSPIETIDIDGNNLTSLPNFSNYPLLKKVTLFNNKLTFEDLLKITTVIRYDTVFQIWPQQKWKVGQKKTITEGTAFALSTGIDATVSNVRYEWYHKGKLDTTVLGDKRPFIYFTLQDSGSYTCLMKHPAFAGFYLETDAFALSANSCLDLSKFSTSATEANCLKTGTLTIASDGSTGLLYSLKSPNSGRTFHASNGHFIGLTESVYDLTISTSTGCSGTISSVKIPIQTCKDYLITPDNDGNMDTYHFTEIGKVEIYDKRGNMVKRMTIPAEWDGSSDRGKVASGYYIASINDGESQIGLSVVY